ncbi:MAG: LacI family DNA-binding transcriptional regulator [Sphaerochaetaceae bacterium]
MRNDDKPVNIKEIAKKSGVSIATVSRVLNNPELVKEETRRKVLEEIGKVNYIRNMLGMQLRTARTHTIGLIHTSLLMDFYNSISFGVERAALQRNYNLIICNSEDNAKLEAKQLKMLVEKRVDGIIISPTEKNLNLIKSINESNVPVCCIDRYYENLNCDYVRVDNENGAYNITKTLIEKGYRNIAFLAASFNIPTIVQRLNGYQRALEEFGMPFDERLVYQTELSIEGGRSGIREILSSGNADCIFVSTELLARGAYPELQESGVKIPEEIGLVLWDNPFWTQLCEHKISVISQPTVQIGEIAANTLIDRLTRNSSVLHSKPILITLETTFIDRETTPKKV